jgi:RNase H-fold protein (predicted Holliday junction resolvase)
MIKTIEERLEEQEEVLQLMLTKLQTLEDRKIEFPEIRIPDYNNQLEILKKELLRVNHSYPVEKIDEQIIKIKTLRDGIPEVVKVRHHHHFEDKSKGFMIGAVALLLVCAIAVGIAVSMWKENGSLNENSVKFRVIRQGYPDVAYWADTTYHRDPEEIEQLVEKIEDEQLSTAQAEAAARANVQGAIQKKRKLKQLRQIFKR